MKFFLFLGCLSFASVAHAHLDLNTLMTPTEKKETGYDTLTLAQQTALTNWIEDHFTLKSSLAEKTLYLSVNIQNGTQLELSDGSIWEVSPKDRSTSALWITPFPLKIIKGGEGTYPDTLINLTTQEQVRVRLIGKKNNQQGIETNIPPSS